MKINDAKGFREVLFDKYDGFADKRVKNLALDRPFIVDDRGQGDLDTRGRLFLWFCPLYINVATKDKVALTIRGDMPMGAEVKKWLKDNKYKYENNGVEIILTKKNIDTLVGLIKAIEVITQRRYPVPPYKYVVPRTVKSLTKLYKIIKQVWA